MCHSTYVSKHVYIHCRVNIRDLQDSSKLGEFLVTSTIFSGRSYKRIARKISRNHWNANHYYLSSTWTKFDTFLFLFSVSSCYVFFLLHEQIIRSRCKNTTLSTSLNSDHAKQRLRKNADSPKVCGGRLYTSVSFASATGINRRSWGLPT